MSRGLAGLLANDRRSELFKNFALHFVTHPSLLFTDTVEPSVGWAGVLLALSEPSDCLPFTRSRFSGRLRNVGRLTDNTLILGPLPDILLSSDIGRLAIIGCLTDMQKRVCNTTYDRSMTSGI